MPGEERSLESLFQQVRDDPRTLGTLLARYRSYLRLKAAAAIDHRIGKRCDGSDVVQETLLRATANFHEFQGTTANQFAAWIEKIQENVLAELIRKHVIADRRTVRREQKLPPGDGSASLYWYNFTTEQGDDSVAARLICGERALELAALVDGLPEGQREAIRLRFLEGQSLKAMAELLEKSEAAISAAIYRGMTTLRKKLPPE